MGKKSLKSDQKAHFGQFQRHGLVLVDCILLAIHRYSTEMPPKQRRESVMNQPEFILGLDIGYSNLKMAMGSGEKRSPLLSCQLVQVLWR